MTEWRIPGMPRVPGLSDLLALTQTQAEALSELPATLGELNRGVAGLTDALAASKSAAASAQRTTARVEQILDEIEGPILALLPGIERLAAVLDDPVIERLPATIEAIEKVVLPISAGLVRARRRWGALRAHGRSLARRSR